MSSTPSRKRARVIEGLFSEVRLRRTNVGTQRGLPRSCEQAIALIALSLLSPGFCLVAAAVLMGSGRPVFFRQSRVGRGGRPFTMYKFRTMRPSEGGLQVTADDDPRITPVGRILRNTKLDELPELWNVVKGDMSLVGPRPEALSHVDVRDRRWLEVLAVRPGLTDPVTLALRNEQSLLKQVREDREQFYLETLVPWKLRGYSGYLRRRSWWTDIVVLWMTAVAIAFPRRIPSPSLEDIRDERGVLQ